MNLSGHLSASGVLFSLLLCNLIIGGLLSNDCTWSYITRPPVASFSPFPPVLCDPFHSNSSLTLPCQVRGPSLVDIDWYFVTPGNDEKLLTNSAKHGLISSVIFDSESVKVSVNLTLRGIKESEDNGTYVCRPRVASDVNKVISPSVQFTVQTSQFKGLPCDSDPIKEVDPLCAMLEDVPPVSTIVSRHSMPVQSMTTLNIISPSITPTEEMVSSNHLLSSYHYVSATPSFTQTGHAPLTSPAPSTDSAHPNPIPPVTTTSTDNQSRPSATPPVNTWFYLLSVVVVLTFLMIILVLILVIVCIMKRGSRRHLVHFPSPREEIGIQRTGRLPSDPLPRIRNDISNNCTGLDTNSFQLSTLPQNQLSFIHSAPAASPAGNHASSLQHLSFNLGPAFQSNSTLYDEIGPPSGNRDAPDIRRHSLDYVNRWQFTLESDTSDSSYAIPPDAYQDEGTNDNYINESGTASITGRTRVDAVVTVTDDSGESMSSDTTTTTTSCMWLSNTPVTITQCNRAPWGHRDTFGEGGLFPLSPLESSEVSRSPLSSEDLPEGFSESETDDNSSLNSIPAVVVRESHTPSDQNKNTLSGQTFELDSNDCVRERIQAPIPESPPTLHHFSPFFPIARNSSTSKITRENEPDYPAQTPPNCSRGDSPPDTDESLLDGRETDGDNSRSSSSSSGCTDISKYSGDYDRDPAYMRLLLGQVRPLLPGNASPEMLSEDYNGQGRADSGMDSLYREALSPTGGLPAPTCLGNLYPSTNSSGQYKSLTSLTLEAESMYVHVCSNQNCHCRLFQSSCTD